MALKLAFDLDGVFCDFSSGYAKLLTRHTGIEFPPVSDVWPTTWYWERDAGVTKEQEEYVWKTGILHEGSQFWLRMHPMDGAIEALSQINGLIKRGHDVYFVSTRAGHGAKLQTEKWLYRHGIDYPTVLLASDKVPYLRTLGIDFFVDDKPETIEAVMKAAQYEQLPCFGRVFLKTAPYNRDYVIPGVIRVSSVADALKLIGLWED